MVKFRLCQSSENEQRILVIKILLIPGILKITGWKPIPITAITKMSRKSKDKIHFISV